MDPYQNMFGIDIENLVLNFSIILKKGLGSSDRMGMFMGNACSRTFKYAGELLPMNQSESFV